jgi:hypothetical protein
VPGRPGEFTVRPLYYGMLFAHLMGSGKFLPVTVTTPGSQDYVPAFALKPINGRGLRVIVENLTAKPSNVTLSVGGTAKSASVLHLTAAGLTATSGVRIQGAAVQANGTITPGAASVIACSSGNCELALGAYTAALVTIP